MASWYRRFIPHFHKIIEPLNRLLKKDNKCDWGIEQKKAFEKIKELCTSAPILTCQNFSQPFHLEKDASDRIGSVFNSNHKRNKLCNCLRKQKSE